MSTVLPPPKGVFDEMLFDASTPRPAYGSYHQWLAKVAEQ